MFQKKSMCSLMRVCTPWQDQTLPQKRKNGDPLPNKNSACNHNMYKYIHEAWLILKTQLHPQSIHKPRESTDLFEPEVGAAVKFSSKSPCHWVLLEICWAA